MMALFFFILWIISMLYLSIKRIKFDNASKNKAIKNGNYMYLDSNQKERRVLDDHPMSYRIRNNEWYERDDITGKEINLTEKQRKYKLDNNKKEAIKNGNEWYLTKEAYSIQGYPYWEKNIYGEDIKYIKDNRYKNIHNDVECFPRIIFDDVNAIRRVMMVGVLDGKIIRPVLWEVDEDENKKIKEFIKKINIKQEEYRQKNGFVNYEIGLPYHINLNNNIEKNLKLDRENKLNFR